MLQRLYVFDFDNTLVNTAEVIRRHGYCYQIEQLRFDKRMAEILQRRLDRGLPVIVLSHRKRMWLPQMSALLARRFQRELPIVLVRHHALKWFYIQWYAIRHSSVTVVDDMLRAEETGAPIKLLYPPFGLSNIRYIKQEKVIGLRGAA